MKYLYKARTKEGKIETGTVEASTKEAAAFLLQKYNIAVTSLKESSSFSLKTENITFLNKVSGKDLAIFSRQLAVMMQSRVPVTQSLKGLAIQIKNPSFKQKVLKISQLIEEGNSLSEAFGAYPEVFNVFYVSMIKTGEASGKISESLYYLSDHLERQHDITSQVKSALIYPAFVIGVLGVVMLIVIFFVMPKLVDLLKQTTTNPPVFTALMINFYSFLMSYGWVLIIIFFALAVFVAYYFMTKGGKKKYDEIVLRIPFLNEFLKKIYLIEFAENVATLIGAGLSINNALKITKGTVNNYVYQNIILETENRVSEGERVSAILASHQDFIPAFVVQMIQVGEETGHLDKNLMEIVNFYKKEVDRAIKIFTALLEPILIIFLGGVVALLAVSVIEPLYSTMGSL